MDVDTALHMLRADPGATGVFADFDGTLSEIVDDPAGARPVAGAAEAMERAAATFRLTAVISGRSLEDLRSRFAPPGVVLAGAYGRERSDRGGTRRRTEGWEAVSVAAAAAAERLPGVVVERKGAGVALHYRAAPDLAGEVAEVAGMLAEAFELDVYPGRLVAELVAPGPGKGDALRDLVTGAGLSAFVLAGDDVADVEAFGEARDLGTPCVLVAVASEEAPPDLIELADLEVSGPAELVGFLRRLTADDAPD